MAKTPKTIDPNEVYKSIRKPMPPPSKVIEPKRKYKRSDERKEITAAEVKEHARKFIQRHDDLFRRLA